MQILSTLIALATYAAGLLAWRMWYSEPETAFLGLTAFGGVALLSILGGIRLSILRRRAFLNAAVEKASWLRHVLTGTFTASATALISTLAITPGITYHLLTSEPVEVVLSLALGAAVACGFLALEITSARHIRPLYRASLFAPVVVATTSIVFAGIHVVFAYRVLPLPSYLDAGPGLVEVLTAAQAELPRHQWAVFQVLSLFRALEAIGYWLLAQTGFAAAAPLALFLVQGAVIHFGLAKIAVDLQALFHAPKDKAAG